jgi:Type I phosphodiesterase / nucleotide pyrophosphatase
MPGAQMDRRRFLRTAGAGSAGVVLSSALGAPWAAGATAHRRFYVLVVDGCRPDEVTPTLMPRVSALRALGTAYPSARALPVTETIPNHTMMMAGVRPDRTGVPANSVYDRSERAVRDLDRPDDLRFPTVLERLEGLGLTTGTVLSKQYLYGVFGARATYRWEPQPVVPGSGHAPDGFTMDAALAMLREADPDMMFVSLGDCDRVGHGDVTGSTLAAARTAALVSADSQVGRFVDELRSSGRWDRAVVLVLADHAMDWSHPHRMVSLAPALEEDPMLAGHVRIAQNGGADLLYWTGPPARRDAAVRRMRARVAEVPGVLSVHRPGRLRLGLRAGDLVAFCRSGWRFSDPQPVSNPIPGNHGHPATAPIPFFVSGGSSLVLRGQVSSEPASTLDVAPTVGSVFGLPAPRGGYDGRALL